MPNRRHRAKLRHVSRSQCVNVVRLLFVVAVNAFASLSGVFPSRRGKRSLLVLFILSF